MELIFQDIWCGMAWCYLYIHPLFFVIDPRVGYYRVFTSYYKYILHLVPAYSPYSSTCLAFLIVLKIILLYHRGSFSWEISQISVNCVLKRVHRCILCKKMESSYAGKILLPAMLWTCYLSVGSVDTTDIHVHWMPGIHAL